ncbi:MAG: DMT family transporter [Sutterellaceae bacterium]|nr:DMT family transporter [Sutterellaceae bacterium]MDY2868740.1 DMT family transporter [Mesosutterella sp.]
MRSLWMLAASFFFALMGAFVKMGAADFSSLELVGYRSVCGVILLGAWIFATGRTIRTPYLLGHFKRCFIGTFSMSIWFYSLGRLPLATGLTLNYTNPLFMAAIIAFLAFRKKEGVPWGLVLATITGFVGVVLMLHPTIGTGQTVPALIGLFSGLLATFVGLQIRELARVHEPVWRIVFYFTLFGTVWGFAGHLIVSGPFSPLSLQSALPLIGIGLSATAAQLCMTQSFGVSNILVASILQYTAIIFAALFGFLFFGDAIAPDELFGIAVIAASSVAATFFIKAGRKP